MNSLNSDLELSGVFICTSPNLDTLTVKFDSKLPFEDHVRGILNRVSQRIGIFNWVKLILVDNSLLLRCYYVFMLPIPDNCSRVCESAAHCQLQLFELQVHAVASLCPHQGFLSLASRRRTVHPVQGYMFR